MKFKPLLAVLILSGALAGCAPVDSMNPLYDGKTTVFDPALLGQWQSGDGSFSFTRQDDSGYELAIATRDDGGQVHTMVFEAHLVELQGRRFLDIGPTEWSSSPERWEQAMKQQPKIVSDGRRLLPVGDFVYLELPQTQPGVAADIAGTKLRLAHEIFKVELEDQGQTLTLAALDESWVAAQVQSGAMLDHEGTGEDGDSFVLTASTADLQELVTENAGNNDAFSVVTTLRRAAP